MKFKKNKIANLTKMIFYIFAFNLPILLFLQFYLKTLLSIFVTIFYIPFTTKNGIFNNLFAIILLFVESLVLSLFAFLIYLANSASHKKKVRFRYLSNTLNFKL